MPKKNENKKTTKKTSKKVNNKEDIKARESKHWFKDFKAELKKIAWPTRHELFENTVVVITMVIIVSVIIFLLDLGFKALSDAEIKGIDKVKNQITASNTTNETSNEASESNETSNEENSSSENTEGGVTAVTTEG
jgi:preprotein translocase subunit SecE